MKNYWNYFFLFIGVVCLAACKQHEQKEDKKGGVISGNLLHASGQMIYIVDFDEKGEHAIDSVAVDANGNFSLHNPATEKSYYALRTDQSSMIFLLMEGGENIEITGDTKNLDATYSVKGSEDSELIRELKKYDRDLTDSLNVVYTNFRDTYPEKKDSAGASLQKYYTQRMDAFAKDFITRHPHSLVSLSASRFLNQNTDVKYFEDLRASLAKEYTGNKYFVDFESLVNDMKKLPVGSAAPEISLKTPDGKAITLSSLKGKTVLIDFWASWCGPCRKENPHVVELYRKFKSKNFEILGVSLDENADEWKAAIKRDHLTWLHGSELKKWNSEVAKSYMVDAIPYSVLVDKDGKIVAKGLSGDALEQKLIETL
jgi:thiol-disulfide isomerase/thioredoxin